MAKHKYGIIPAAYQPAREGTHGAFEVVLYSDRTRGNRPIRVRKVVARDPFAKAAQGLGGKFGFGVAHPYPQAGK